MLEQITFILEIIGTVAFAISGALIAIEKKMDVLGVIVLGLVTAVGGGVIRDIILGITPPRAFSDAIYAEIAVLSSLVIFFPAIRRIFEKKQRFFDTVLLVMDSLGLGVFTVVGIAVAKSVGFSSMFLLVFVGVVTGCGGGVLRDMMSQNTPYIFRKHFYCTASIIGALCASLIWDILGTGFTMLIATLLVFVLRLLAAHFRWKLPRA